MLGFIIVNNFELSQTLPHDFEPFLIFPEAYQYKGPKPSFHIPGLDALFLYRLLLSHLGAGEKSSPQETKGSISFIANIADMRIPFQIICK